MKLNNNINIDQGDCLELMNEIEDKSVDLILCDLPYGTTRHKWDSVIPFDKLWEQYNRIIKEHGAIVLFGCEPFSTKLKNSNMKMYRYDWIWEKNTSTMFLMAKKRPLLRHELISVFYKHLPTYNPQFSKGKPYKKNGGPIKVTGVTAKIEKTKIDNKGVRYPTTILRFNRPNTCDMYHPTEKPVDLLKYLIKTYTNEKDTVLDNCMGSGSTGVACIQTNRKFIGYELNDKYFKVAKNRIINELNDDHNTINNENT